MSFGGERYNKLAIMLHWLIAVMVFVLIAMGIYMSDIPKGTPDRAFYFNLHKSIGVTVGILVLFRIWWRHKNPPPQLDRSLPSWQILASKFSHGLLYLSLILMPIFGFAASQFTKYGVTYFGLFKIPPMGPNDPETRDFIQSIHHELSHLLIILIVIHVLAAMYHQFIRRDGLLRRMFF